MNRPDELLIERVAMSSLTPDPENARSHDEMNLKTIVSSLSHFGQVRPIVVSADGVIYAGNGTYLGAQFLGWEWINVARMPADWSEEKMIAYALADNRTPELSEWDKPKLASQLLELDAMGWEIKDLGFDNLAELEIHTRPPENSPDPTPKLVICPRCQLEQPAKRSENR